MISIFGLATSIAYLLYVLHHTTVIEEYLELLQLDNSSTNLFYFSEYKKFIAKNEYENDWQISYIQYLTYKRSSFLIRLMLCPFCISFWLSLIGCLFFSSIFATLSVAFLSCLGYFIIHSLVKLTNK